MKKGECGLHDRDCGCSPYAGEWVTKDSGVRAEYPSGMVRDTDKNKPRYDLIPIPILKRWADLAARGAEKYGDNNWMKADSQEELDRFEGSAQRHMYQWLSGETDEDHAAAVLWNVAAAEVIRKKIDSEAAAKRIKKEEWYG